MSCYRTRCGTRSDRGAASVPAGSATEARQQLSESHGEHQRCPSPYWVQRTPALVVQGRKTRVHEEGAGKGHQAGNEKAEPRGTPSEPGHQGTRLLPALVSVPPGRNSRQHEQRGNADQRSSKRAPVSLPESEERALDHQQGKHDYEAPPPEGSHLAPGNLSHPPPRGQVTAGPCAWPRRTSERGGEPWRGPGSCLL